MSGYPGGDVIGIVTDTAAGTVDSLNQPITIEAVVWIRGCVFDLVAAGPDEQQTDVTTNSERAFAFLPIIDGLGIPAVNADGTPALDDNGDQAYIVEVPNAARIRPKRSTLLGQRDYKVIGRPEVQYDLDGQPDHVWIACEWRSG